MRKIIIPMAALSASACGTLGQDAAIAEAESIAQDALDKRDAEAAAASEPGFNTSSDD